MDGERQWSVDDIKVVATVSEKRRVVTVFRPDGSVLSSHDSAGLPEVQFWEHVFRDVPAATIDDVLAFIGPESTS